MNVSETKKHYGIGTGLTLLSWAAILAYLPSYLSFAGHWVAIVVYVLSAVVGVVGAAGTVYEVLQLWPLRISRLNDNVALALFMAGLAAVAHFLGRTIPQPWIAFVLKVAAVGLIALAAIGFAFSTEDAIRATLTHEATGTRTKIINFIKTAAAFVVGVLSAAAAALELLRAFR